MDKKHLPKISDKIRIPRNVNYYLHFLQHPEITENDIEWVLQLRHLDNSKMQEKLAKIPNQAFSVSDKHTIISEKKKDPSDIQLKSNAASFMHLLSHRVGLIGGGGQVEFETGLRRYTSDQQLVKKEKTWTNIPHKDRNEFPEFPKTYKEQTEIRKSLGPPFEKNVKNLVYTGFDGHQNYPSYTMQFQQRNCGNVKHLFGPDTSMSTGMWEEGLRDSYQKLNKLTQKKFVSPPKKK